MTVDKSLRTFLETSLVSAEVMGLGTFQSLLPMLSVLHFACSLKN